MLQIRRERGGDRLEAEWDGLLMAQPAARVSQSALWARAAGAHSVWTVREGADLVAVWPARRTPFGWRAHGAAGSDCAAPLLHPERPEAFGALAERLGRLDLPLVPEDHPAAGWGRRVDAEANLLVRLPPTWDEYERGLSKSLRQDVRRRDRLRLTVREAEAVEIFLRLHATRWRARGLPGAFVGARGTFLSRWWPAACVRGWAEAVVAEDDGGPVAAALYLTLHGRTSFYQAGMRLVPGHSPGTAVVAEGIARAIQRGDHTFDLLRGDEPYKRRWRPTEERRIVRQVVGRAGLAPVEAWVARGLRARFEGKGR